MKTEELWVYSTNIKNNRFYMKCVSVVDKVNVIECIVDTGAFYTAFTANMFQNLPEEKFMIDNEYETKYLGGFVKSGKIKFYKVPVKQFTIGNIDMERQNIWVTFSEDVTESVLGMDILKQITFFQLANSGKICFLDKNESIQDIIKNESEKRD